MSTVGISPTSIPGPIRTRARACTACRQVKLRCNAREVAPDPCSRCQQQGLECKMDASFKRVPARKQLEEVSNRLTNLQRSLGLDQDPHFLASANLVEYMRQSKQPDDLNSYAQKRISDPGRISSEPSTPDSHQSTEHSKFYSLESETEQGSWTLGDVTLDAENVRALFRHFDHTHFRHVPFLEPCTSLDTYHRSSKLLFWTVVLASCLLYNEYDEVYRRLVPHHRALLPLNVLGDRVSLSTIHSMLLMCTWQYPVSPKYDDLTWILCGSAIHMAMMYGLHRPSHFHEYGQDLEHKPGSAPTRKITWLACFIISTGVSSWLGMPPPLGATTHLETIADLCEDGSIPIRYRARAEIQKQVVRVITSLDSKLEFRTRHSLIRVYEQDFDKIRSIYHDVWTDDLNIEWLGAKLNLFGIGFISHEPSGTTLYTESPAVAAREVLLKGLAAAVGIIDTVFHMKLPHTREGENRSGSTDKIFQLGFYPKIYFRIGAFANFFLLWFLAVDSHAPESDKQLALVQITWTYKLLLSFKNSPEHLRAGKAIEQLASMDISAGRPSSLRVNSRLGASFMYSYTLDRSDTNPALRRLPILGLDRAEIDEAIEGAANQQDHQSHNGSQSERVASSINTAPSVSDVPVGAPPPQWQATEFEAPIPIMDYQAENILPMNQEQVFSNAFFQNSAMQNWDFPGSEWDPSIFSGFRMPGQPLQQ